MSDNLPALAKTFDHAKGNLKDKIQELVVKTIPDEVWEEMVEAEFENFKEEAEELIHEEVKNKIKERIQEWVTNWKDSESCDKLSKKVLAECTAVASKSFLENLANSIVAEAVSLSQKSSGIQVCSQCQTIHGKAFSGNCNCGNYLYAQC